MANLIRGSQLVDHSIRMGKQSLKSGISWLLLIWLILLFAMVFIRLDRIHLETFCKYGEAWWYRITWHGDTAVRLPDREKSDRLYAVAMSGNTGQRSTEYYNYIQYRQYRARDIVIKKINYQEIVEGLRIFIISSIYSFLLALCCWFLLLFFICKVGQKTKDEKFIRGSKLVTEKALIDSIKKYNKKQGYKTLYQIAGLPYPALSESRHTLICGTSGSGKSIVQKELLAQIIANGDRAIVYDFTGAYVESFYREGKDVILNPFDSRSKAWSLLEEVEHIAEFDTIAAALIGDRNNAHGNNFWIEGARIIFKELCKLQYKTGDKSTQSLIKYLNGSTIRELSKDLAGTSANHLIMPSSQETTMGLIATLTTYLSALNYVKEVEGEEEYFSIKKWIRDLGQDNILYLSTKANLSASIYPLISAMMDIAINNMMGLSNSTRRKTWFIFDEIASLNCLPSLKQGLTVTRNFGGCFVIGIQEKAQLVEIYGREGANTIISNCSTKLLLKAGDPETARWSADILRAQEVMGYKENISYGAHAMRDGIGLNQSTHQKQLVLDSELLNIPDLTGFIIVPGEFPAAKVKIKYKEYPVVNMAFMNDLEFTHKVK